MSLYRHSLHFHIFFWFALVPFMVPSALWVHFFSYLSIFKTVNLKSLSGINSVCVFSRQVVSDCLWSHRLWHTASLSVTISRNLPKFMSIEYNAIQPSHPLLPSPSPFNLSQYQGLFIRLFPSGGQSIGTSAAVSVLPMNIQGWFPLGLTGLISLLSKGLKGVFSGTTVWKHQFFGSPPSLWSNSHICTWLLEKP